MRIFGRLIKFIIATTFSCSITHVELKAQTLIERDWVPHPDNGLSGTTIALWNSHGYYFDLKSERWQWQRARLYGTVEDLLTGTFTFPYLIPMLENAGAYVIVPRERDSSTTEIIVDGDGLLAFTEGYSEHNGKRKWETHEEGFAHNNPILTDGLNPFKEGKSRKVKAVKKINEESKAIYSADIPETGDYALYVSYSSLQNSSSKVPYVVHAANGDKKAVVNQKMGGGTWIYLGTFPFTQGRKKILTVSNFTGEDNTLVSTDAIKIGGGLGNVGRKPAGCEFYTPTVSGKPRYAESARYWLQWAGVPDSIYSVSQFEDDYADDYKSRGLWVNYLCGGSKKNPDEDGLKIPVDLAFALHTDAGLLGGDSIVGTMAIYSTDGGSPLGNGSSRNISKTLADMVQTQVVEDIQLTFEPEWTRRKLRNAKYAETRTPKVPAMILELLSHQNPADIKYAMDPEFRFIVSRAIYKGILKFLCKQYGVQPVVQPLPVNSFSIDRKDCAHNEFRLNWEPTADKLERTAKPDEYIIEMKVNDGAFKRVATVKGKTWKFIGAKNDSIYSFRIVPCNDGGEGFPSEILACATAGEKTPTVNIVNGFTRIGAPIWKEDGKFAGFRRDIDSGVQDKRYYGFTGDQYIFDISAPWVDNDFPGFGASRADMEDIPLAGNSFDFVYIHGKSILASRFSFISQSIKAFTEKNSDNDYEIVDLILGKQKESIKGSGSSGKLYKTFPILLQKTLTDCTANGISLFVSGSYVVSDLWQNPFSDEKTKETDMAFAKEIIGIEWVASQASTAGEVVEVPVPFPQFDGGDYYFCNASGDDIYPIESPDGLKPTENGYVLMRYADTRLPAATASRFSRYNTVVLGFPFETVEDDASREKLMNQILTFLISK